jgi:long-chain acyl-CoA synthetase
MIIKDCLNRAAMESPEKVALRFKQGGVWKTRTYSELRMRAWHVAEMLTKLGIAPGDRVAIYRENSPEWYELYHGIVGIGAIAVPVDAKLREMEVGHILHDCGIVAVFTSCCFVEVLAGMAARLKGLRTIVMLDCDGKSQHVCEKIDLRPYEDLWEEVSENAMAEGRAFDSTSPDETAPASFIYTSGTTGRQKGAVLTHRNFMSNVKGIQQAINFSKEDNVLLILPLHHSFAFTTTVLASAYAQCEVTIVENLKTIKANMAETSPTIMLAVPLLLEKMLARIMGSVNEKKTARILYKIGLGKIIGRKVNAGLGGSLRLIVSGGAPISPSTLRTWSKLGFCIIEGYGITETAPVLAVNPAEAPRIGTVGLPLHNVEVQIKDPDSEGAGEIIARGDNVMKGYHNNPEETAKVLVDGWYHTGDIGYFDEKGYLVISGRKKSLIVNREGKNIYPEEVEQQVLKSHFVLECLAMGYREPGGGAGERVGLIAVLDQSVFDAMEERDGKRLNDREIDELVREDIREYLSALSEYKRPRKIEVRFDEFEKTTTQKVKRYLYAINTTE